MGLTNTHKRFGSGTKILHWLIFILFVTEYALMYRRDYFPKGAPEKTEYMLLHKSLGLLVLGAALLMIILHYIGKRPKMPENMSSSEIGLARLTHFLLYLVMLLQPITGIAMSQFAGYKVSFFGLYTLPMLVDKTPAISKVFNTTHIWTSYFIIGLVALHLIGALYHHWFKKDDVLKRMMPQS